MIIQKPLNRNWEWVTCVASGPSLSKRQIEAIRKSGMPVIAVNRSYEVCEFAKAVFGADRRFWNVYKNDVIKTCPDAELFTLHGNNSEINEIKYAHGYGLADGDVLKYNANSGLMAINLAYLFGAKKILMVGYDFKHTYGLAHFHSDYDRRFVNGVVTDSWFSAVDSLNRSLQQRGTVLLNCSLNSAIESVKKADLMTELEIYKDVKRKTTACF